MDKQGWFENTDFTQHKRLPRYVVSDDHPLIDFKDYFKAINTYIVSQDPDENMIFLVDSMERPLCSFKKDQPFKSYNSFNKDLCKEVFNIVSEHADRNRLSTIFLKYIADLSTIEDQVLNYTKDESSDIIGQLANFKSRIDKSETMISKEQEKVNQIEYFLAFDFEALLQSEPEFPYFKITNGKIEWRDLTIKLNNPELEFL